jgi:hypothetical protein
MRSENEEGVCGWIWVGEKKPKNIFNEKPRIRGKNFFNSDRG